MTLLRNVLNPYPVIPDIWNLVNIAAGNPANLYPVLSPPPTYHTNLREIVENEVAEHFKIWNLDFNPAPFWTQNIMPEKLREFSSEVKNVKGEYMNCTYLHANISSCKVCILSPKLLSMEPVVSRSIHQPRAPSTNYKLHIH